jgi:hypothetical protein
VPPLVRWGPVFGLDKWYGDCVTSGGDVLIVYAARVRLGHVRFGCSSILGRIGPLDVTATHVGRVRLPSLDESSHSFEDAALGVRGTWRGTTNADERTLWSGHTGSVRWHPVLLTAQVELTLRGQRLTGVGYLERLRLDVAPWRLPIEELRWGRFHGAGRSVVWIEWRGLAPLRLCLVDGVEIEVGELRDDGFELADGARLELAPRAVLRDGKLGQTVLRQRLLRWLPLPRSIRAMHETKWLASGSYTDRSGVTSTGSAIHEVVRWA